MIVGIIGGTGLAALGGDSSPAVESADTPFGSASDTPRRFANLPNAIFLNRHGEGHTVLPHEINYRANVWLLKDLGASAVVAVFAVGGISRSLADGDFVVPGQLVDYTWGRAHTFAGLDSLLRGASPSRSPAEGSFLRGASPSRSPAEGSHVDFSDPFDARLREMLGRSAGRVGIDVSDGVYGCTQGPRFETVAEIDRMERDGCTVVGMTAMPEAALARELGLPYAGVCLVVNPAAGRGPVTLELADMLKVVDQAQPRILDLLVDFLQLVEE
ncbi:MAG: S-methyl-5'-thioadenosine phosphorylase [Gammaproteobacteria bacterium]|nr:S-methyl-5'-thioadenosine phosphorylase [Gammaproteobacteria bacterium]